MILEVPERVILADGTTGAVKGVAASVVDGRLDRVILTVEKANGGWTDVAVADVAVADVAVADVAVADVAVADVASADSPPSGLAMSHALAER